METMLKARKPCQRPEGPARGSESQPGGLRASPGVWGPANGSEGQPMGSKGQMGRWIDRQMENLLILQGFLPYWSHCPKRE